MNLVIFCAIFCFPTSLAFQVSFYKVDLIKFQYCGNSPSLVCTPHQFMYQRGDNFTLYLKVLNDTSTVTEFHVFIKTCPGIRGCRSHFKLRETIKLQTEQITIDVELFTKDGMCLRQTILEGREMPANASNTGNLNNDICIKENHCIAIVDEATECKNIKPQPCGETSNRSPRSSTSAPLDWTSRHTPQDESLNETYKMLKILNTTVLTGRIHILNSLERPTRNVSIKDAETSYFTVMIITSVTAAVALILLLVIAFRRFCRKNNSPGLPQKPATENRYYENMLFRDECQQQIDQLEQRALEDRQPSELQYEEINNRSNRW